MKKRTKISRKEAIYNLKEVSAWMRDNVPGHDENRRIVRDNIKRAQVIGAFSTKH